MVWNKDEILRALRKLHKAGADLSYNSLAKKKQSLVSAAAYHFGSYRRAVEKAGIDYAEVTRRPRWSKASIIQLIKQARRDGEDLHWSAVTGRGDELAKAAFASLQPRLFGSWDRALHGAGLNADEVNRYRKWTKDGIISELRQRYRDHEPLNSGAIQRDYPGLHAAAVRHFSSYDEALRAAKLDPEKLRERRSWKKEDVIRGLKNTHRAGKPLSDSAVRREHPALYGAAVRLFGSFTSARSAAGIQWKRRK
ncbi:MAG TPA: hypothetical protein VLJ39_09580 [Tepidisphaeraceae bacterium]|nr:hypothetical protein [Tepidisphaeraceae bacterium]